jgi:hypothetical protein
MMSQRTVYHVVYDSNGKQWRVLRENASRASSVHATKMEAIAAGRELAKNNKPSKLMIHKMDGSFEKEYTYGSDPERYPS